MAVYKMTPTKANLIKAKSLLGFSKKGYELLDRKRMVLIKEMMSLIDKANDLQEKIDIKFQEAYLRLGQANITMGTETVQKAALSIDKEKDFNIQFKSVMGIETPHIKYEDTKVFAEYGFFRTNPAFDKAVITFNEIRKIIYELGEVENSVYKLAMEIKKTQKRANALDKIQIPRYTKTIKYIEEVLEEKEREDFFRLKKVKDKK